MMRNDSDTCITTVPSFFRCPISLDIMRSPVSLCTGVTYDRASIQRWLDGGNNTCPATMQVLKNKELVPNLTLQRLIQAWYGSVGRRTINFLEKSTEDGVPTVEQTNDALAKLNLETNNEFRLMLLSKIARFAKNSERNKEFLAKKPDFISMLISVMAIVDGGAPTGTDMELVLRVISILDMIGGPNREGRERLSALKLAMSSEFLTAILLSLRGGSLETKIESVKALECIAIDAQSKLVIVEREGIIQELIKSIATDSDTSLIEATLSFLIAVSNLRRVRSRIISAKAITKLKDLLLTEAISITMGVTEKALKLLEMLLTRREGRSEICGGCVEGVVRKLLKVSPVATEHAVAILWIIFYVYGEEKTGTATTVVERSNVVTKLLVVMQSNCSPAIRQMAKDLIKVLKVKNAGNCMVAYHTTTTHIMPF